MRRREMPGERDGVTKFLSMLGMLLLLVGSVACC